MGTPTNRPLTDQEKIDLVKGVNGVTALIVSKPLERQFSQVPNLLHDSRSPYRVHAAAAGYYHAIKMKPDNWQWSLEGFIATCMEGKAAVRKGLDELEEHGWLLRMRPRSSSGRFMNSALWVLLSNPSEYDETLARLESLGFAKTNSLSPHNLPELQNPRSEPKCHFSDIGEETTSDLGIVENTHSCGNENVENSAVEDDIPCENTETPRSEPKCQKTYIGKSDTILYVNQNNKLNKNSASKTRGSRCYKADTTATESRSPDGSLNRSAEASLSKGFEKTGKGQRHDSDAVASLPETAEPSAPSPEVSETATPGKTSEGHFSIEALRGYYPRSSNSAKVKEKEAKAYRKVLASGTAPEDVFEAVRIFLDEFEERGTEERFRPGLLSFMENDQYLQAYLVKVADEKKQSEAAELRSKKRTVNEAIPPLTREEIPFLLDFAATNGTKRLVSLANRLEKTNPYKTLDPEHPEHQLLSRLCRSKDEGLAPQFYDFAYKRLTERSGR